ncbi:MAG: TonB-dependent receptor [Acidobacteria bacterium]|nr:TonB-dependent receptor [Acidobacteriota bacterium]
MLRLVFLIVSLLAYGQQSTGVISGLVTDSQDAAAPGAKVEVFHVETGATFRTESNGQGIYNAPGMAVGRYEVRAERAGFKRAVRSGITLQVNQTAQVNLVLQVGQVAETIEVKGEASLVDTGSATVGTVIDNRQVQSLPLNGRGALALSLLTPGVLSNAGPTNSGFGDRGIALSSLSINGSPNSMNAQMLDGNNNILSYVGEAGIPPAVDAVEEFKVQSGTMSAEFGFTAGGAINLVTKSGTNSFRGTLYEFLRNDKFDARNAYAINKLPFRYNQFGGTAGGAFIKNRTFGFYNYEAYKMRRSNPRIATVPLEAWRNGDFSTLANANGVRQTVYDPLTTRTNPAGAGLVREIFPGNVVPRSRFDPITPKVLAFWPLPNRTPLNQFTQTNNFQDSSRSIIDWNQTNWKIDNRFSDRNSLFVRYTLAQHAPSSNSFFLEPTVGSNRFDDQTNRNAVVSDTHTFSPTLINSLRVGIMRQSFVFQAINAGQNWPSKLGLPAIVPQDQMPEISFGYGTIGGGAAGNRGSLNWDIQNMMTKIWGAHSVKFGYNHRILQGGNRQGSALSGSFAFGGLTGNPQSPPGTGSDLAQFLMGEVSSANIDFIIGNSWHAYAASFFVQDDWKVSRRLNLNIGLRYDFQQKPYERHNGQINFDLNQREPITGLPGVTVYAGRNGQPRSFYNEDHNDFGPRFGFAYDIFGTGKTVLRGGYGIFYPAIFYREFLGSTQLFSTTRTPYIGQGPGQRSFLFKDGFPTAPLRAPGASAGPSALLGQGVAIRESFPATPMSQQWDMSLQQQIGSWLVDVTYSANKGTHFAANGYNLNQVRPETRLELGLRLSDPVPNPLAGKVPGGLGAAMVTRERTLQPYPHYNGVSISNPRFGNFMSHLLLINVKRRFDRGLLVNFSFTGGKKISDSTTVPVDFGPVEQTNENGFQDGLYNRRNDRSVDPADVSKRGVLTLIYELPFGPGRKFANSNGALGKVVGGWQLNLINVAQAGIPLTVRGASNFQADRPNSTGVSAKTDNPTARRWFNTDVFVNPPIYTFGNVGRTIPDVRHPGAFNIDFSMIKDTQITERIKLQFRAEAFNLTNKVNLGLVNDTFAPGPDGRNASAAFGTANSSRDARVGQLALKLYF